MSFQQVKPTKPELNRIVKKKKFSQRGENLLEVKREQLFRSLRSISARYFEVREVARANILENMELLKDTYKFIGKEKVERISNYNIIRIKPTVEIKYVHRKGIDLPVITLNEGEKYLPSYSFFDTALHIDILIKNLQESLKLLIRLGELDKQMYLIAANHKKINRRIDALEDIIIPKLDAEIRAIEDILFDEEREEYVRLKKIKEILKIEEESYE
ncbi:MAG: V-type ATP synthase subunit D [Promethearchaeota archaeon]